MQSYQDNEDMEAWLAEVELAHDKIKKLSSGELSIEELDKQEIRRQNRKQKEDDDRKKKELEAFEKKKEGREGKGQDKDYINFCRSCFVEYELQTDNCIRCRRPTISQQQRYAELTQKVQVYKEKKSRKEEHRQKWELWQKTQKILWKKNSTNYNKWEYFTSDSEEELKTDPILPKNDPNFIALERDLQERKKKKDEALKNAEQFKLRGNEYMKSGQYEHAVMKYSQALELVKDVKAFWLNRALAYLKLQKYRKCISDCSKVIDYADCFEKGWTESRESCFKAFLRRGTAYKERKEYDDALKDSEEAIKLCPKDKEAESLKKDIQLLKEHQLKVDQLEVNSKTGSTSQNESVQNLSEYDQIAPKKQQKEMNFKEVIDSFVAKQPQEIRNTDFLALLKSIRKQPEQAKVYFYEKKAINKLIETVEVGINEEVSHTENLTAHLPPLVIQVYLDSNPLYQENFITAPLGMNIILKKIDSLLKKADGKQKSAIYDTADDYLEILDGMVEEEKSRLLMQKDQNLIHHIYPSFWNMIPKLFLTEPAMAATFITLCSNLCYGVSLLKQTFELSYHEIMVDFAPLLDVMPSKSKYLPLLTATCNLLSNFLSENSFRQSLIQDKQVQELIFKRLVEQIKSIDLQEYPKSSKWVESALAVFVNLSYQAKEEAQKFLSEIKLGELLLKKFILNENLKTSNPIHKTILSRSLQILSKINYTFDADLLHPNMAQNHSSLLYQLSRFLQADSQTQENEYTSHVLRLLMQVFSTVDAQGKELLRQDLQSVYQLTILLGLLRPLILNEQEIIFCNACNAIGYIIDSSPLHPNLNGSNPSSFFHQVIPRLITVVRDKVGNTRKNAAILLAKLTKEEKNLQTLRDLHGIEILHSVYNHIMQK